MNTFTNTTVTANFLRLAPGSEVKVSTQLKLNKDNCYLFKFLGTYDVLHLEFRDITEPSNPITSIEGLLEISSISMAPISPSNQIDNSNAVDNLKNICSHPIVAIIFIQLKNDSGYIARQSKQQELIEHAQSTLQKTNADLNLQGLLSYGKDDLCIILGTDSFESIFKLMKSTRDKFKSNLIDSTTYTTINFDLVENRDELLNLKERVSIEILATCEPGYERSVTAHFDSNLYQFRNILGKEDIKITSKSKIPAGKAIATLLDSRSDDEHKRNSIISTTTYISHDLTGDTLEVAGDTPPIFKIDKEVLQKNTTRSLALLEEIGGNNHLDQHFVQMCKGTLTKIRSSASIVSSFHLTADLSTSIEHQLIIILEQLKTELNNGLDTASSENAFQYFASNLEIATAQRSLNINDYRHGLPDSPNQFGQGTFLISEAVARLVRQIYETMESEDTVTGEWEGFIIFSQFHGFKCFTSSVFSLPSNSLTSILDPSLNWLTLSHEICHDVWGDQDEFTRPRKRKTDEKHISFKGILEGKAADEGIAPPDSEFSIIYEPMLAEWYVHWFDFNHFYHSDFKFYAWSIWSSWLRLPLVRSNTSEYLSRTLVVYVSDNLSRYEDNRLSREEIEEVTSQLFDEMISILFKLNVTGLTNSNREKINKEKCSATKWIVNTIAGNIGFIHQFNATCKKAKFAERMKYDVDSYQDAIKILISGKPVENCENTMALLIACMKSIYTNGYEISNQFNLAFLMSCILSKNKNENRNTVR